MADERDNVQDGDGAEQDDLPSGILPEGEAPPAEGGEPGDELVGHSTGEDIPDLDDIDWGDADLDGDGEDDDDDEHDGTKKRVILLISGVAILFISVGAAAWFIIVGGDETPGQPPPVAAREAEPAGPKKRIEMAMPRMGTTVTSGAATRSAGGLNALGAGTAPGGLTPSPPLGTAMTGAAALPGAIAPTAAPGGDSAPGAEASAPTDGDASARPMGGLNAIGAAAVSAPGTGIVVPSVMPAAFAKLTPIAAPQPLPGQPDPALVEQTAEGPLPKIGEGGRQPWQYYAKPFDKGDSRPRVAIIVGDMGLSQVATAAAITRLPQMVTLAFDPYAPNANQWALQARAVGHEILVMLPVETETFPVSDPGPQALMTTVEPADNLRRLNFSLTRLVGYVGIVTWPGSRFNAVEGQIRPVLEVMKQRGLMFVDGGAAQQTVAIKVLTELGVPGARNNLVLDGNPAKAAIDAQLAKLELLARQNGTAIGLASPYPSTLERLVAWIAGLEGKNIALAPVSALPGAAKPSGAQAQK